LKALAKKKACSLLLFVLKPAIARRSRRTLFQPDLAAKGIQGDLSLTIAIFPGKAA
jgi:hypothetical protein